MIIQAVNIVPGINSHIYQPDRHHIVTAASCTTNCLAPIVKVLHEEIGIKRGQITTIHDPTNTNVVTDRPHKDWRRARSSLLSLQPTSTGSARAIGLIYPELEGLLNGHAVRVPVLNASLTDCVFDLAEKPMPNCQCAVSSGSPDRFGRYIGVDRARWSRLIMSMTAVQQLLICLLRWYR